MVFYYLTIAAATLGEVALSQPLPQDPRLHLPVDPAADALVDETLQGHARRPLIGINPGAAYGNAKRWPLANLGRASDELAERTGGLMVSTASIKEAALNDEVQRHCSTPIHRFGEELDLAGLAALPPPGSKAT